MKVLPSCSQGLALVILVFLVLPNTAFGYVGPGAGLSAIGAFLAILAGIVIALFGFIWYPIKRLLRGRRRVENVPAGGAKG